MNEAVTVRELMQYLEKQEPAVEVRQAGIADRTLVGYTAGTVIRPNALGDHRLNFERVPVVVLAFTNISTNAAS